MVGSSHSARRRAWVVDVWIGVSLCGWMVEGGHVCEYLLGIREGGVI